MNVANTHTEEPLVSVIMPTYNHAGLIGEAIQSVLDQTYKNVELIIIDNYSEDETEMIVRSFQDERIRYLKFRNHGIIAASRNHGITYARGDYIAFLDSDDIWLPRKLEKQIDQLQAHKDIMLSYVLSSQVFEDGETAGPFPEPERRFKGNVFKALYLHPFIPNSGVIMRKKVLEEVGLLDEDPKLVAIEDTDMWLRIARTHCIDYVEQEPLLIYRVRKESIGGGIIPDWRRALLLARRYAPYAGKRLYMQKVLLSFYWLMRGTSFGLARRVLPDKLYRRIKVRLMSLNNSNRENAKTQHIL